MLVHYGCGVSVVNTTVAVAVAVAVPSAVAPPVPNNGAKAPPVATTAAVPAVTNSPVCTPPHVASDPGTLMRILSMSGTGVTGCRIGRLPSSSNHLGYRGPPFGGSSQLIHSSTKV